MTLAELLSKADMPAELEFKDDKGNVIKLGDLRSLGSSIEDQKKTLAKQENDARAVAEEAQGLAAALKKALDEQAKKAAPAANDKEPAWRKNPLYEDLLPVIDALEQGSKAANARAEAAGKSLAQMSAFYTLERLRGEYNAAPENWRKTNAFEKAVAEALANQEVTAFGEGENAIRMPTLSKRIHAGTEADRIQSAVTDALKKNNAEWEIKTRMAAGSGKPGGATKFSTKKAGEAPIKKLEELTSEAIQAAAVADPQFAAALESEPS